jgi:ATP-dependent Clp protease ATP-binding subunit ClpC
MEEVKRLFNPEFLNRVDEIVVFRNLGKEHMLQIIDIVVDEMLKKIADRQIDITLDESAKEFLAEKGFDPVYGARPLKRAIQKYIEDPIAEEMLKGLFADGSQIQVKSKDDSLDFVEIGRKDVAKPAKKETGHTTEKGREAPEIIES